MANIDDLVTQLDALHSLELAGALPADDEYLQATAALSEHYKAITNLLLSGKEMYTCLEQVWRQTEDTSQVFWLGDVLSDWEAALRELRGETDDNACQI